MKVLAFGDSFVKMFIHCKPQVRLLKFKGKSIKGLVKPEDQERKVVERQVRKTQNGTTVLMFFGQVDFNYVRYYKALKDEQPITQKMFKQYVEWVSSLNSKKNITIVSIFPSPIQQKYIIDSLTNKGSYLLQNHCPELDNKILNQFSKSLATWKEWNAWIKHYCQKYNVNNLCLFKEHHLEQEFYDVSPLTAHLRYVPVLKEVQKYIDVSFDENKAMDIQKQYEKEKLERISQTTFTLRSQLNTVEEKVEKKQQSIQTSSSTHCVENVKISENFEDLNEQIKTCERKNTADLDTDSTVSTLTFDQNGTESKRSSSIEPAKQKYKKKLSQKDLKVNTQNNTHTNKNTKARKVEKYLSHQQTTIRNKPKPRKHYIPKQQIQKQQITQNDKVHKSHQ